MNQVFIEFREYPKLRHKEEFIHQQLQLQYFRRQMNLKLILTLMICESIYIVPAALEGNL